MTINTATEIKSPCVRNCCLDLNDVCVGCLRNLEEIKHWGAATRDYKQATLQAIEQRKKRNNHSIISKLAHFSSKQKS